MNDPFLNLTGARRLPVIYQAEAAECGLACLAMISGYHGHEVDLATFRRKFPVSLKGTTLATLMEISANVGLACRAIRLEVGALSALRLPAVLHWEFNHFVVLKRVRGSKIEIHDPAIGARTLSLEEVSSSFTGVALELSPTEDFKQQRERNPLTLGMLIKLSPETIGALWQTLVLTLVIESLYLATPFYMQMVIDEAILKGDRGFLGALALAFFLVLIFNTGASALRSIVVQYLSNVLSFESQARLLNHLLRLPLDWFQKRHVGDIQSRFQSIGPVKQFVATQIITVSMDGVLSIFVLFFMVFYSPMLCVVVLASTLLYASVRVATLGISHRVESDFILARAREQTRFLETIRATQTIKVSAREVERESLQRNAMAVSINAGIRAGNVQIVYQTVLRLIVGGTDVLVIFLGAKAVMDADLTVGMLMVFLAYKVQFTSRITNLVESLISWRLLDVHLERIADIALNAREPRLDGTGYEAEISGGIEASGLCFRYAPGEPLVVDNLSLQISPGEYVAVTGTSGCGKSTLLKLLMGLYQPTGGEVRLDGRALTTWSPQAVRQQIGVVLQEDQLMQGSIAENIAGFAERVDMARVVEVAILAHVHDSISAMPMGYQSLVGDMGSTLSGGQKQRVMIARALYRRPKVLILDEGTSHLDVETEKAISQALAALSITRVVVAHRPETIRAASREICLSGTSLLAQADSPECVD